MPDRTAHVDDGWRLEHVVCRNAADGAGETVTASAPAASAVLLRLTVSSGAALFSYSLDGVRFHAIGDRSALREARWMGAKFGLAATRRNDAGGASADVDWIRVR